MFSEITGIYRGNISLPSEILSMFPDFSVPARVAYRGIFSDIESDMPVSSALYILCPDYDRSGRYLSFRTDPSPSAPDHIFYRRLHGRMVCFRVIEEFQYTAHEVGAGLVSMVHDVAFFSVFFHEELSIRWGSNGIYYMGEIGFVDEFFHIRNGEEVI